MGQVTERWRTALRLPYFREQGLVSVAALFVTAIATRVFLDYVESRPGAIIEDPLLPLFAPANLRWITYSLIYAGMLLGVISLCFYPFALLLAIRAVVVLSVLRIISLLLLPLDPPPGALPLVDPFLTIPEVMPAFTRDLFFSWSTAMAALFAFTAQWKDMKIIFAVLSVVISALLLLQHAHYTIDVVAAPCFAYAACGLGRWMTVGRGAAPATIRQEGKA